ncbi:DUF3667 domain-containing protein [Carboxylicivirga sp. N1Y90]|uniref:DUF3667 domain-containing protein n=1 Tax=Carboxylicivirga fragile TaxID=3417571 RepID=UPI003D3412DD|nr:DUF3667 domain-containing protein [Marinilabiliaceae bacterium N1Y90]
MEHCINCQTEVDQNYCPSCGHPRVLKRIDGHYILHEVRNVLNFEKGILYTIRGLSIRPGKNIRGFLNEDRNRLVKPIVFLIVTSLIYSLINTFFHFEEAYISYSGESTSATTSIFAWVQSNYGYANIILAVFIGFWLKLFFRKLPFNFFEILIMLCFVMGMSMLIYAVFGLAQGLTGLKLMQVAAVIGFTYTTFAIGQFFDKGKVKSYVKTLFANLLGMLSASLLAVLIGALIDLIR